MNVKDSETMYQVLDKTRKSEKNMPTLKTVMDNARKKEKGGTTLVDVRKGNMARKTGIY